MEQKEEEEETKQQSQSATGVALGLVLCGISLVVFSRVIPMANWLAWFVAVGGLAVELLGCLGVCIERCK